MTPRYSQSNVLDEPAFRPYRVVSYLGSGCEGDVYEVLHGGDRRVLKVLHRRRASWPDILAYADRVREKKAGLYPIQLITDDEDVLRAISYEYEPLTVLSARTWRMVRSTLAPAFLGRFCEAQAHLLQHGLALVDSGVSNFLLSRAGRLMYVDYGSTSQFADNPSSIARGSLAYAFANILLNKHLFPDMHPWRLNPSLRQDGFDWDRPSSFLPDDACRALAQRYPWTRCVLELLADQPATIYRDRSLYLRIAAMYPDRVPRPGLTRILNRIIPALPRYLSPQALGSSLPGLLCKARSKSQSNQRD